MSAKLYKSILETLKYTAVLEYSREVTIKNYGSKLIDSMKEDEGYLGDVLRDNPYKDEYTQEELEQESLKRLLSHFEEADPTPNNKYVIFLAKNYSNGKVRSSDLNYVLMDVREALAKYDKLKRYNLLKPEHSDILKFRDFSEFVLEMTDYDEPLQKPKGNEQAETVYEDDEVRVIVPHDENAACYYGKQTKWCTAATKGDNRFEQYNERGCKLYILIPKQPEYSSEKYQLCFDTKEYKDELNKDVSLIDLFNERFTGGVRDFFSDQLDILSIGTVQSTDDQILVDIETKIYEIAYDKLQSQLSEMEFYDDGYQEYLRERGYEDVDFDQSYFNIDWESVIANEDDYIHYNASAMDYINEARRMIISEGAKLKRLSSRYLDDLEVQGYGLDDSHYSLSSIPDVISWYLREQGDSEYRLSKALFHDLAYFIEHKIEVIFHSDGTKITSYRVRELR
jgi:hypothetical protein